MTASRQPKLPTQKRIHRNRWIAAALALGLALLGWTFSKRNDDPSTVLPWGRGSPHRLLLY